MTLGFNTLFGQRDVRETATAQLEFGEAVPIGAVLAWFKSISGVPTLPAGYVQCDGQTLSDASSLLDGQVIPDINGSNGFLRGAATSGGTAGTDNQTASGTVGGANDTTPNVGLSGVGPWDGADDTHTHTFSDTFDNKPAYTNVVWIMRVK